MAKPMKFSGKLALVTGAGGGIGRAIAISLSQRDCNLILADINTEGASETAKLCKANGIDVTCFELDVSKRASIAKLKKAVMTKFKCIDYLVNNAGVAIGGTFEQTSEKDFEWLMDVNFYGVVRMCRAFLPLLKKSSDARIVNLSSIYGIIAPSKQSAYAASKFAVRGFSQVLAHELEKTNVGVTIVHPGGVATSIAKNARAPKGATKAEISKSRAKIEKSLKLSPEIAGEVIVNAIENRRQRVLVGNDALVASLLERIFPVAYWNLMRIRIPK